MQEVNDGIRETGVDEFGGYTPRKGYRSSVQQLGIIRETSAKNVCLKRIVVQRVEDEEMVVKAAMHVGAQSDQVRNIVDTSSSVFDAVADHLVCGKPIFLVFWYEMSSLTSCVRD